jgi:protein arginine kinase activator
MARFQILRKLGCNRVNMKCDMCEKPALVHEVTVRNGVKKEMHLCEAHAAELGFAMPGQQPISHILTQFVISKASRAKKPAVKKACPTCGLSYSQFKRIGVLGCPDCYEQFDSELSPLIERAQNGGTHHSGKTPKRAGKCIDRQRRIQQLLKELDSAVAAEQYERAAQLRDTLRSLEVSFPASAPSATVATAPAATV